MNTALVIADSGPWSLGVLIMGPIMALVLLAVLALAVLAFFADEPGFGVGLVVTWFILLAVVLSPIGFYPFHAEYHQWRETSGTVSKIDKRLISSGKSMEDKFVVRFDGDGQQFGCDDTRCAGVEVGDKLTLSCKRAWQYTGTDGYDCRFVSTEAAER